MKRLSNNVKNLLKKSKESCLLAVDVYNKPLTSFKSGAYIVLMIIAWTSLFHAIFEKQGIKYYYKEKNNYFYKKDETGEKLAWGLGDCLKNYKPKDEKEFEPIKENLRFFIKFRNQIEHRFMPELDDFIFGECQALLNNYEKILMDEFDEKYLIKEPLSFSLQFSYLRKQNIVPSNDFKNIKNQIIEFRNNLPSEILSKEEYSFNIYLIKTSNKNSADYAITFIHESELDSKLVDELENAIMIRHDKKINVSNSGNLLAKDVCKKIQEKLSLDYGTSVSFKPSNLNKVCEVYNIKYDDNDGQRRTNSTYCIYDDVFDAYSYNPKIVDFLVKKLNNKEIFVNLFPTQKKNILGLLSVDEVVSKVKHELFNYYGFTINFGRNFHLKCCEYYKIRPTSNMDCEVDTRYCEIISDNRYAYTDKWVDFLVNEFKDKDKYLYLFPNQKDVFFTGVIMSVFFDNVNLFEYMDIVKSGVNEFDGTKKYIATGSLDTNKIHKYDLINYESRPSRANMEFKENDIIFAKMKETEKVFLIDSESSKHIFSTGFAGLRINDYSKLIPKYVYYWLRSSNFQDEKDRNCSGATQKAINFSKLKDFTIPVFDINIQKQIVNKLEKIEELISYRNNSLELLDSYLKSVFLEMFGDPINNTKNWDFKRMGDFGVVKTGNTPSRNNPENYGDYIEWIKSDNINTPFTYLTKSEEYLSEIGYKQGRVVPEGSVLVTCIAGSIPCLGNVAITDREVAFNQQINSITPNDDCNELFLYHLILYSKPYLQSFSRSALKGMINKRTFENIPMIHPPIELQNQFAEIVKQVEEIKKYQLESKKELENLFNNLMQKAFKGELIC